MYLFFLAAICLLKVNSDNWAFLLAGSREWSNYRHQSDIAHANKFLRSQGFDSDKIITLMYDDIARNSLNPYYNFLRNHLNGSNVYEHLRVDYSKENVNPKVVYASLSGNLDDIRGVGSGRFLNVTQEDSVFIYFSDHGATRIFSLPDSDLEANDIVVALTNLKKRCKYVLVFVEACESGSLFANKITKKDVGILTVTASRSNQSSYAIYYDDELQNYLGDEFSVNFLEYLDRTNTMKFVLRDLVRSVKNLTKESSVSVFGDFKMLQLPLTTFFKSTPSKRMSMFTKNNLYDRPHDKAPAHEVDKLIAEKILMKTPDHADATIVLKTHNMIKLYFEEIRKEFILLKQVDAGEIGPVSVSDNVEKCYRKTRKFYFNKVKNSRKASISFYYLRYLNSLCFQNVTAEEIVGVMSRLLHNLNMLA